MEEHIQSPSNPDTFKGRGQPITIIAQLMRQTKNMQHVDEVFSWLAQALAYYLDIAVVQFLAIQRDDTGRFTVEARAIANPASSLSHSQISYVNQQITTVAERVFQQQRGIPSGPVESIFPPLQAALFTQHNLRCWAGYFLRNDAVLPPARNERTPGKTRASLNMIVSLFTLDPLSAEKARAIHFILEQTMRILVNRGLLTTQPSQPSPEPAARARKEFDEDRLQAHLHLVPRRAENIEQYQADNPFANASIIPDKNARRLYTAIDDDKDIGELSTITGLSPVDMLHGLHYLFAQQKIRFYTPDGEIVPNPPFSSSL